MDYRFNARFRLTVAEFIRALQPGGMQQTHNVSVMLAVMGIGYFLFFTDRSLEFSNIVWLVTTCGAAFALPIMVRHSHRKLYRQDPANAGLRTVDLSSDGISTITESSHVLTAWHEVDRVEARDGLLFFHSCLGGFHLLPERVFGSAGKAEAGRKFIRSHAAYVNFQPLNAKWFDVDRRGDEFEYGAPLDAVTDGSNRPEIPRPVHYAANLLLFYACISGFMLLVWLTKPPSPHQASGKTHWLLYYMVGTMALTLVSSLPAGVLLKHGHRYGRPAAFVAFVFMLPGIPCGPIFGLVGIMLLLTRDARRYFAALAAASGHEQPWHLMSRDDQAADDAGLFKPQTIEVRGDMNIREVQAVTRASPGGSSTIFILKMSVTAGMSVLFMAMSGFKSKAVMANLSLLIVTVLVIVYFVMERRRNAWNAVAGAADYRYVLSEDGITTPDRRMQHLNWSSFRRAATFGGMIVLFNMTGAPAVAIPMRHFRDVHEYTAVLAMIRRHVADCSQLY